MDYLITVGDRWPRGASCPVRPHCTAMREKPSRWVLTDGAAQAPAPPIQNERTRHVESGDVGCGTHVGVPMVLPGIVFFPP